MAGRKPLRVDIVHWMPVEMYPPVMNLARFLAGKGFSVSIHTTRNRHGLTEFSGNGIAVKRSASPASQPASAYSGFYLGTTRSLVSDTPDAVIYFEPQSSFPVFAAGLFRKNIPIFIHHHEYHTPEEFDNPGMRLARMFHSIEQRFVFPRASWISHTNDARRDLFLADNGESLREKTTILRNLPPASWLSEPNRAWRGGHARPLRMVYVGSLSCSDTYIEDCVKWVHAQDAGAVTLDVYAYNTDAQTADYLRSVESGTVRFHPKGVAYDELPQLLRDFHCGLILYKAHTVNYRHNASNKLFEYLACGLDVLFPPSMLGVKPYERTNHVPRVMEIDFAHGNIDLSMLSHRDGIPQAAPPPTAEDELAGLAEDLGRVSTGE